MVQSDLPFRLFFYGCEKFMGQMPGVDSIKRTYGDIASETYLINLINAPKEIHFFIGFKHIRIQNFDFLDNCYSFFFSIFLHRSRLDARFILPVFQFLRLQFFFPCGFYPKIHLLGKYGIETQQNIISALKTRNIFQESISALFGSSSVVVSSSLLLRRFVPI